jgi:hypothetical protein
MMSTVMRLNRLRPKAAVVMAAIVFLAGITTLSLEANYLTNTDLKDGFAGWNGDGEAAFLTADGIEGADGDKGVIPVIKLPLSKGQARGVYQEIETKDNPSTFHARVQVYASNDFQRSKFASDYSSEINWRPGSVWYWSAECVPNVDFWIRVGPGYMYKLANLKPGQWVTVDAKWDSPMAAEDRAVYFFVPPGDGTVYIKNPSVTP